MPRLNGTDLCAHLLEERPEIRVLVMSAADMSKIVSQNANLPFLPKPFDGRTLRARVRSILAAPVQPPMHLPELRSEQKEIEQEIRFLERFETRTTEAEHMDVTRTLSELRSEQEEIEQEIHILEGPTGPSRGQHEKRRHSVTEIRGVREPGNVS